MLTRMNLSQSKLAQMVPFKAQDDDLIVSATRSFRAAIHTNWVTAKVIENRRAKRFINRLDVLGFEYLIQHDNHDLRILVRSDQLEEALGWFEELARPRFTSKRKHWRTIIGLVAAGASDWHVGWLNFLKPYWLGWFIVDSNFCDLRSDGGYCSGFAARLVLRSLRDRRIGAKIASLQRQKANRHGLRSEWHCRMVCFLFRCSDSIDTRE